MQIGHAARREREGRFADAAQADADPESAGESTGAGRPGSATREEHRVEDVRAGERMPRHAAGEDRHRLAVTGAGAGRTKLDEVRCREHLPLRLHRLRVQAAADLEVVVLAPREAARGIALECVPGEGPGDRQLDVDDRERGTGDEGHPLGEPSDLATAPVDQSTRRDEARLTACGHALLDSVGVHARVDRLAVAVGAPCRQLLRESVGPVPGATERQDPARVAVERDAQESVVDARMPGPPPTPRRPRPWRFRKLDPRRRPSRGGW